MKTITMYTKGAAKGNPGAAVIGVYVVDSQEKVILEKTESIGNATNEYAEYYAVVRGLQLVQEMFPEETRQMNIELRQENKLVNSHLHATQEIKDVSLIGHFIEIYNLRVSAFPNLTITLVQSAENAQAGSLVTQALDGSK